MANKLNASSHRVSKQLTTKNGCNSAFFSLHFYLMYISHVFHFSSNVHSCIDSLSIYGNNNNNNNNCLKSNIQCIEIRVQWTVHLGSSHMHVPIKISNYYYTKERYIICFQFLTMKV